MTHWISDPWGWEGTFPYASQAISEDRPPPRLLGADGRPLAAPPVPFGFDLRPRPRPKEGQR